MSSYPKTPHTLNCFGYALQRYDADSTFSTHDSDRDLLMLMNLNGRERTLPAFKGLFRTISPPLRISRVHKPPQGELSLIEVVLDTEACNGHEPVRN